MKNHLYIALTFDICSNFDMIENAINYRLDENFMGGIKLSTDDTSLITFPNELRFKIVEYFYKIRIQGMVAVGY